MRKIEFSFPGIFNYEKPPAGNSRFKKDEKGMICMCLPACHHVDDAVEVVPKLLVSGDNMTLDFHFQSSKIVKYQTDVTFGYLDLIGEHKFNLKLNN